ncbi:MAG: GGDEF domain-containing protein [Alphaproteobacteria bacterium]|jgi:diguanylate cyclase (GGDEF)-like protein|nr:GGDEF domain-containing protein [Alphaproteobacteria bacterium]MBT4082287.1 GGDEF domain-containing protein [Alphaproteobacteria bacterium]MBT4542812.1 GGDEF domain-containing protein [Alphaproteobacteria bacterium]MBT7744208.1 GGDEF domain-containing protein [Alphaproteobacteria bacterium]
MTASMIALDGTDPNYAAKAAHLTEVLRDGLRNRTAITRKQPWQLLEQMLDIVDTAEERLQAQKRRIKQLESQVLTDPLTGLVNRRGFDSHLKRILADAHRHGDSGVLVYIDLDDFKPVNDNYGHEAGDAVLKHVAKLLGENIRTSDIVARLGGDEFAVILTHTSAAEGMFRTRKLQGILAASQVKYGSRLIPLQASFGAAPYDVESSESEVLRMADAAMYDEKRKRSRRIAMAAE